MTAEPLSAEPLSAERISTEPLSAGSAPTEPPLAEPAPAEPSLAEPAPAEPSLAEPPSPRSPSTERDGAALAEAHVARRNQLTRAAQWFAGIEDDPYGLLLRAGPDDPARHEERVRERGPLYHSAPLDTWVTAHRAVAEQVLTDPAFDGTGPDGTPVGQEELPCRSDLLALDRATAARLAPLTAFGGPLLWAQEANCVAQRTATYARRLLESCGERFDLAEDFARRLPGPVLAEQLSLPDAAHEEFARVLPDCRHALDGLVCPQPYATARATRAAEAALAELLARHLSDAGEEAVRAAGVLAVSAAETTAVLIVEAVRRLRALPGAWERLAADPALAEEAVRETLRTAPPVRLETRVTRRETTLAGTVLPAGGRVVVLLAAAGRDPAAPAGAAPLGLAPDLHFALSAPLITAMATAALRTLAETLPRLREAGEPVTRPRSPVLLAPARFPVAKRESTPCAS
ncbi:cytochrome P450 family protein [Streptomyces sp. DH41]|uniref:cytochrome P450 family protein n=1 Tax=Streptomyces sp. DH41 TaxID=3040125 RepID=UPI002441E365|nr:P450-derived glycosyltransferase activator [Streptomyces sp. DH41]MDG9723686.1 P450-derived glycosyltransferase activator [Streptomyces sp. DH41]